MIPCWSNQLICAAVHRIASKTIKLPTDDALRLSLLYPTEHVIEDGAARRLSRLLLDELFCDIKAPAL